jgi:GDP-4-dehydro-6-deoxy-D-mannose reductase
MNTRCIVTGANGFIGRELVRQLKENNYDVEEINRLNDSGIFAKLNLNSTNMISAIASIINEYNPKVIFHLAAETSINKSWQSAFEFISTNISLTENLIEALKVSNSKPLLIYFSSSAVYAESRIPLVETSRLSPNSPYAISKFACESSLHRYKNSIVVRPFFTIGARKSGDFIDDWLIQLKEIKDSSQEGVLKVGNLKLKRDFLEVSESARILIELSKKCLPGEVYNICSGTETTLEEICQTLIFEMDCSRIVKIKSESKINSETRTCVIGSADKLVKIGIQPNFQIDYTLKKIISERFKVEK